MLREQIPEQKENTKRADRWLYIAVVCLLVAVIGIAVLRCRSLIQEIGEDRTVTSSYVWEMELPAQNDWFYLTFFKDDTFAFYGPKRGGYREVGSGTYEYDDMRNELITHMFDSYEDADITGIRLVFADGTERNVIHFGDRMFVATDGGIVSFKKFTSTPTAWSMDVEPLSLEDLQEMSADELFDLFIRNGLVINERMANTLSEEVIKETLKSQTDILIEGITPCNDIMYWDFADSVKETYEKISGERE